MPRSRAPRSCARSWPRAYASCTSTAASKAAPSDAARVSSATSVSPGRCDSTSVRTWRSPSTSPPDARTRNRASRPERPRSGARRRRAGCVDELAAHGLASAVMQTVDRGLGAAHAVSDLPGRQADQVAKDHNLTLLLGQRAKRLLQAPAAIPARVVELGGRLEDLLAGEHPPLTEMVKRDVASHPEQPGCERDLARLVLVDHRHELEEHVLGDVLGFVRVAHEAQYVAVHVVFVLDIEEADRVVVTGLRAGHRGGDPAVTCQRVLESADPEPAGLRLVRHQWHVLRGCGLHNCGVADTRVCASRRCPPPLHVTAFVPSYL